MVRCLSDHQKLLRDRDRPCCACEDVDLPGFACNDQFEEDSCLYERKHIKGCSKPGCRSRFGSRFGSGRRGDMLVGLFIFSALNSAAFAGVHRLPICSQVGKGASHVKGFICIVDPFCMRA